MRCRASEEPAHTSRQSSHDRSQSPPITPNSEGHCCLLQQRLKEEGTSTSKSKFGMLHSPVLSSCFAFVVRGDKIWQQNKLVIAAGSRDTRSPVLSRQSPSSAGPRCHLRARVENHHIRKQQADTAARVPIDRIVATGTSLRDCRPCQKIHHRHCISMPSASSHHS